MAGVRAGEEVSAVTNQVRVLAGVVAALALAFLLVGCGGSNDAAAPSGPADPTAATSEAIRFWEERVRRDPADFIGYNKLADAYIQRARQTGDVSDYSRAEAALKASLQSLPNDNYAAVARLASVYATKHQFGDALEAARQAIATDPSEPFGYAVMGDALLALGRYDDADNAYLRANTMAPGLSSFSRLAYLLELRGDLKGAEAQWQNALETDNGRRPEDTAWARVQVGDFYFSRGDLDAAQREYQQSVDVFPDFVHALAGLAKVRAVKDDYDDAASLYSRVVARYPAPEYVAALGDVYHAAGRDAEAARQYGLVDAIDRLYKANGVNTDLQMALYFADHDVNLEEALRQARDVYAQRPSIQAADAFAWALYKSGRYQEALDYSDQALRLGTQDASMFFHGGMIHYRLGQYQEARSYLQKAVAINPRFSVLFSQTAADTLHELQAQVGGQP